MKRLHFMLLRMLPGPLLGWLCTLMFLLLMQFLIRYLKEIAGKGLPLMIIVELVVYNLAYMLVLAVPMSVLLGTMMVFGRLAETRSYVVVKSAGISPLQLIWPTLLVGLALTFGMTYFNNILLPESNFRASSLWRDIRRKQPGFELKPGVFYDGLSKYSILVQRISPFGGELRDVLIYDYTESKQQPAVIKARQGTIAATPGGERAELVLYDGELHRMMPGHTAGTDERYERLTFARYKMQFDLTEFAFERSDPNNGYRSDRTMRTGDMVRVVDSLEASIARARRDLHRNIQRLGASRPEGRPGVEPDALILPASTAPDGPAVQRPVLQGLPRDQVQRVYDAAILQARSAQSLVEDTRRSIEWQAQRADRYRVEIHKKFSIAIACLIFALIGAPLGLSIRRGGLGAVGALATGIFLFYWVTLVQGEKLADRGFLVPWVGMWIANIVMIALGLWLMLYITLDLRATPPLRHRLLAWMKGKR